MADVMAQWVKLRCALPAFCILVLIRLLVTLLPIQLAADVPGKAAQYGSTCVVPWNPCQRHKWNFNSWPQFSPALAVWQFGKLSS